MRKLFLKLIFATILLLSNYLTYSHGNHTFNTSEANCIQLIGIDLIDWRGNLSPNWDGLSSAAGGATTPNLKNHLEVNTSYCVMVVNNFHGTGLNGLSTGNDFGPVPDEVMRSFWFNQHNQRQSKITLDKTKKDISKFYGGRNGAADDESADYIIGGQTVSFYNVQNIHIYIS